MTRSLRYALARITQEYPELGRHLGSAIHTGAYCSYTPDPVVPLIWEVTRETTLQRQPPRLT